MYRIFIVEDDPVIVSALCAHMEKWGFECRGVEDFRKVTEEFAAYAPHLVLMDISLPFYDGYHWCAEIRKLSKTPMIFLSSAAENMNILMALRRGRGRFRPEALRPLRAAGQGAGSSAAHLRFRAGGSHAAQP